MLNIDCLIEEIEKEQIIEKDNEKTKAYDGIENGKDEEEKKDLEKEHENEHEHEESEE